MQLMRNFRAWRNRKFLQRISGKKPFCSYKKFVNFATLWKRDLSDISTGGFLFSKTLPLNTGGTLSGERRMKRDR